MGSRTWMCMGILLAYNVAASGQNAAARAAGMPDFNKKSAERIVFISGKVMLADGTVPADPVRIERVCDGRALFEAWTDPKGAFSFKVSSHTADVATDDASRTSDQSPDMNKPMNASASQYTAPITSMLKGCELQAVLSGYSSERVSIDLKSMMDDARVGTILLHPLSRASALTVSATSLAAPSTAKKAYQKGLEAMRDGHWDAAGNEFAKAIKAYPAFATAWYELGVARQNKNDVAGAIDAWKQSQLTDPKYVKPYESLTVLADRRGDWAESEHYSRLWIQLDPEDLPRRLPVQRRSQRPFEPSRRCRAGRA